MKKWKYVLVPLAALAVFALIFLVFFRYCEEMVAWKTMLYATMGQSNLSGEAEQVSGDTDIDFSGYAPMINTPGAWYEEQTVIVHACGGIDGLSYTNSREALDHTLSLGLNCIEVDFTYTSDGRLVCMHEWTKQWTGSTPTADEFLSGQIYGKYTPLAADSIIDAMKANPEMLLVIDTKGTELVSVIKDLLTLAGNDAAVYERFIIQLYGPGEKAAIMELAPFTESNFLFTCYKFGIYPNQIMSICYEEDIHVVTVEQNKFTPEVLKMFTEKGIVIYEHTVNRPDQARVLLAQGVKGVYTDFLLPSDLS